MGISNEKAEYLLGLPKKIKVGGLIKDDFIIQQEYPFDLRFDLVSGEDRGRAFSWKIYQGKNKRIKISFHHQEDDSKTGLIRIDYNSGHTNPKDTSGVLPAKFFPFAGKHFEHREHHVHYHVEGYPPLAWAVPLANDSFEIKDLPDGPGLNARLAEIIKLFAKTINIQTKIKVNELRL